MTVRWAEDSMNWNGGASMVTWHLNFPVWSRVTVCRTKRCSCSPIIWKQNIILLAKTYLTYLWTFNIYPQLVLAENHSLQLSSCSWYQSVHLLVIQEPLQDEFLERKFVRGLKFILISTRYYPIGIAIKTITIVEYNQRTIYFYDATLPLSLLKTIKTSFWNIFIFTLSTAS